MANRPARPFLHEGYTPPTRFLCGVLVFARDQTVNEALCVAALVRDELWRVRGDGEGDPQAYARYAHAPLN